MLDPGAAIFFNLKILMKYYLKDISDQDEERFIKYIKMERIPFKSIKKLIDSNYLIYHSLVIENTMYN